MDRDEHQKAARGAPGRGTRAATWWDSSRTSSRRSWAAGSGRAGPGGHRRFPGSWVVRKIAARGRTTYQRRYTLHLTVGCKRSVRGVSLCARRHSFQCQHNGRCASQDPHLRIVWRPPVRCSRGGAVGARIRLPRLWRRARLPLLLLLLLLGRRSSSALCRRRLLRCWSPLTCAIRCRGRVRVAHTAKKLVQTPSERRSRPGRLNTEGIPSGVRIRGRGRRRGGSLRRFGLDQRVLQLSDGRELSLECRNAPIQAILTRTEGSETSRLRVRDPDASGTTGVERAAVRGHGARFRGFCAPARDAREDRIEPAVLFHCS